MDTDTVTVVTDTVTDMAAMATMKDIEQGTVNYILKKMNC